MGYEEQINKGFRKLLPVASDYVTGTLKEHFGPDWWQTAVMLRLSDVQKKGLPSFGDDNYLTSNLDVARVMILITVHWNEIFSNYVKHEPPGITMDCRNWAFELLGVRNRISHLDQRPISKRYALRALDTMSRFCECIAPDIVEELESIYDEIMGDGLELPLSQTISYALPIMSESVLNIGVINNISLDSSKIMSSFDGCIVRKDLTKRIKEGANVPIFVLEYLLGMYCSSDDESEIEDGMEIVQDKLSTLYIRPDEAELIKSRIREAGEGYPVIDKVSVHLDIKKDIYMASFLSLGLRDVPIGPQMVIENPRLLSGGIWCIITFNYSFIGDEKLLHPFKITRLTPIQMPFVDVLNYVDQRENFTKDQWIALMLRSTGIEPNSIDNRTRMLLLARMMALVENNINICELGPRSTGKSHVFKEISPSSILVSGGQATVASLFYNLSTRTPGLVCNWDVVAFDEVAEIKFKDKDAITIMKDYMASGSFSRGGEHLEGKASMVFVGNINESVDTLLLQASLFKPFPVGMNEDTAFLDRFHCYIPGWEIEPFSPKSFTDDYGFICDYFAEIARELRKLSFTSIIDEYFRLDDSLKQRDVVAIRKMVSAMMKLIYPNGEVDKEGIRELLEFAMEMRSRVKEQLKRIQPDDEFIHARFIYHDIETGESKEVLVPECINLSLKQGQE